MGNKEFTYPVTVEFEDVDAYGIANHVRLISFLERGRLHFLDELGIDIFPENVAIVLADMYVRYRKPARLLDRLVVTVALKEISDFKIIIVQRIRRGEDTIAVARCTISFMDTREGGITAAPGEYLDRLLPYLQG